MMIMLFFVTLWWLYGALGATRDVDLQYLICMIGATMVMCCATIYYKLDTFKDD